MLNFLLTCGQVLYLAGYLYFGYLAIASSNIFKSNKGRATDHLAPAPGAFTQYQWHMDVLTQGR